MLCYVMLCVKKIKKMSITKKLKKIKIKKLKNYSIMNLKLNLEFKKQQQQ